MQVLVTGHDGYIGAVTVPLLRAEGHDARGVYRGDAVLEMVASFEPDAALIDIGMPGMNGYEIARAIRERYGERRPFLVAITGWTKPADRIIAELAGFNHHVAKPFSPRQVLELLAALPFDEDRA